MSIDPIDFVSDDFSLHFSPYERTVELPALAAQLLRYTDVELTTATAKRVAINVAERMLNQLRTTVRAEELRVCGLPV
jgi:hypothetical protein